MRKQIVQYVRYFLWGMVLLGLGWRGVVYFSENTMPTVSIQAELVRSAFHLTNHHGQDVTLDDYAGRYKLIFFGFTNCPDVCPTALQNFIQVLDRLGDRGAQVDPMFISLDPARDDVSAVKNYVELFDVRLIGLTGSQSQVDNLAKAMKIYVRKNEMADSTDYMLDHSAYSYFLNKKGDVIHIFSYGASIEEMVGVLDSVLEN